MGLNVSEVVTYLIAYLLPILFFVYTAIERRHHKGKDLEIEPYRVRTR